MSGEIRKSFEDWRKELGWTEVSPEGLGDLAKALEEHYQGWWENTTGTPCQIARLVLHLMHEQVLSLRQQVVVLRNSLEAAELAGDALEVQLREVTREQHQ